MGRGFRVFPYVAVFVHIELWMVLAPVFGDQPFRPVDMLGAMYRFWVFLHLVGMAGFLVTHGVSMAALFQVRAAGGDRERILAVCEGSKRMNRPMYLFTILLLVGGVAAGIDATAFDEFWLWGSLLILIVTMGAMSSRR